MGSRAAAMVRIQWILGLGLTAIIAALHLTGNLNQLEYPSLDWRAKLFAKLSPGQTDELVIVAIDDAALDNVGRWPWPRAQVAQVIRELTRAGAKTIALDLLLDEPQQPRLAGDINDPQHIRLIDDDAEFAAAIKEHGNVVLGMSMPFLDERQNERAGAERSDFSLVYARVRANPDVTLEELQSQLVKNAGADEGPAIDDLRLKMEWARRLVTRKDTFSIPIPGGAESVTPWATTQEPEPPTPVLLDAAAHLASVTFGAPDADGVTRRIPLWVRHADRLYPTLGLAMAAAHLGVPVDQLKVNKEWTIVPSEGEASRSLRMHSARYPKRGEQVGLHYVGWPRTGRWQTQFAGNEPKATHGSGLHDAEPPTKEKAERENEVIRRTNPLQPIGRIVDLQTIPERVVKCLGDLNAGVRYLNTKYGFPDLTGYDERAAALTSLAMDNPKWLETLSAQRAAWDEATEMAGQLLESFEGVTDLAPDEQSAKDELTRTKTHLPMLVQEVVKGHENLVKGRADLRAAVNGRAVLIGWSATGSLADFVPTSIDSRTPGMLVHAAVFNAIMNRDPMLIGPPWLTWLGGAAVVVLGIVGTLIGVSAGVVWGVVLLAMVGTSWFIITGLAWDAPDVIVATTAPVLASLVAWLGVIMHRFIVEQRGRKQTEARFRSYVSPEVVDILVNNPQMDTMRPAKKELTILFSDIAGWTTLSERLGTEGIQSFLRTYLQAMTEELQYRRATIDKYLGDGIMAFWGAPIDNAAHAQDAAMAAVNMMVRLEEMNAQEAFGPIGRVAVRVGLSTGEVSVGDFGNPPYKSSYTVIGDAANVAARLESANKQFGTTILMTERTRTLVGESMAVRPIGRIVLVGKGEPETVYELIGERKLKGERTKDWISVTEDAVNAYIGGRLEECEQVLRRLREEFGDAKLVHVYEESIAAVRAAGGVGPKWSGAVILTEK